MNFDEAESEREKRRNAQRERETFLVELRIGGNNSLSVKDLNEFVDVRRFFLSELVYPFPTLRKKEGNLGILPKILVKVLIYHVGLNTLSVLSRTCRTMYNLIRKNDAVFRKLYLNAKNLVERDSMMGLPLVLENRPVRPRNERYWYCRIRQSVYLSKFMNAIKKSYIINPLNPVKAAFFWHQRPRPLEVLFDDWSGSYLRTDKKGPKSDPKEWELPHFTRIALKDPTRVNVKMRVGSTCHALDAKEVILPAVCLMPKLVEWMKAFQTEPKSVSQWLKCRSDVGEVASNGSGTFLVFPLRNPNSMIRVVFAPFGISHKEALGNWETKDPLLSLATPRAANLSYECLEEMRYLCSLLLRLCPLFKRYFPSFDDSFVKYLSDLVEN